MRLCPMLILAKNMMLPILGIVRFGRPILVFQNKVPLNFTNARHCFCQHKVHFYNQWLEFFLSE